MGIRDWFRRRVTDADRPDTVRFYDAESKSVLDIPRSDLRPGLVQAQVEGVRGVVWVSPDQFAEGPIQYEPFDDDVRDFIRRIQSAFAEHRDLSLEEWEDGFRRDSQPEHEIALWSHAADVYTAFSEHESSPERRGDVYRCVVACLVASPDSVWDVLELQVIDRSEAERIVDRFYGNDA